MDNPYRRGAQNAMKLARIAGAATLETIFFAK